MMNYSIEPKKQKPRYIKTFLIAFLTIVIPFVLMGGLSVFLYSEKFWLSIFVYAVFCSFLWRGSLGYIFFYNTLLLSLFMVLRGNGFDLTNRDVVAYNFIEILFILSLVPSYLRQKKENIVQKISPEYFIRFFISLILFVYLFLIKGSNYHDQTIHTLIFKWYSALLSSFTSFSMIDLLSDFFMNLSELYLSLIPLLFLLYCTFRKGIHHINAYKIYGYFVLVGIVVLFSIDTPQLSFMNIVIYFLYAFLFFIPSLLSYIQKRKLSSKEYRPYNEKDEYKINIDTVVVKQENNNPYN